MRKLIVAAVAAALTLTAPAALAANNAQDDKNNPTYPGTGAGNNPQPSSEASQNTADNCSAFLNGDKGNGVNMPAQCYSSP